MLFTSNCNSASCVLLGILFKFKRHLIHKAYNYRYLQWPKNLFGHLKCMKKKKNTWLNDLKMYEEIITHG